MQPEHDAQLQALFAKNAQDFRDEAFVQAAIRRIEARDTRRAVARGVLWVAGLVGVAVVSPFLIEGASWMSDRLDLAFDSTNRVLYTPVGTVCAIVLSITVFLLNWKRIWVK
jgi:hypothetical protein